jgi:hypothetical protein
MLKFLWLASHACVRILLVDLKRNIVGWQNRPLIQPTFLCAFWCKIWASTTPQKEDPMKNNTQDPEGLMGGVFALSIASFMLLLTVAISLSRLYMAATPSPEAADFGYFGDPEIDPAFSTTSRTLPPAPKDATD